MSADNAQEGRIYDPSSTGPARSLTGRAISRREALALGLLVAALVAACLLLAAGPAHAATFTVNSTADAGDDNPGNGSCFTGVFIAGSGFGLEQECTLRAAIQEANATSGADAINFNIPASGVKTISPAPGGLPSITERVVIDGYTQPGASANTKARGNDAVLLIELDGTNAGSESGVSGLTLAADGNVIRGLVINRFGYGMLIGSTGVTGNEIEGNFIGTDASGTQDLGNYFGGVTIRDSSNNTVGGTTPAARNVISGNDWVGVDIDGNDNKVQGNYIGTDKGGTANLGNAVEGVFIFEGTNNTVGGATSARNTIAFNGYHGVTVFSSVSNRVLSNSIYSNDGLGIDLVGDGITPNDRKDLDLGPNDLQNFPVITSATTTITGKLNSKPNQTYKVQFFSNPSGTKDEGKKFLGEKSVTTGADGKASFTFKPTQAVEVGQALTATATDPGGNTSEFSAPRKVVAQ